jgi:glycosyltransferase involved in cell wall biosynthesis
MISIVIPVFNQDVTKLAGDLHTQLAALNIGGEILIMDDGSAPAWNALNKAVSQLPLVRYIGNGTNHGRIRIRELLAAAARYDWLIFLDGDSALLSDTFVQQYYQHLPSIPSVIVGGRVYVQTAPTDCSLHLHWRYGSVREARPNSGFMSNNFLVHKTIFNKLEFTNGWQGYGHEDTWMGIQLENMGAPVQYIRNNVLHEGLETTNVFLRKTDNALYNLHRLQTIVPAPVLKKHVRLYKYFHLLRSLHLLWLPGLVNRSKFIEKNLHSCNPSLFLFDLYRLARFIQIMHRPISQT